MTARPSRPARFLRTRHLVAALIPALVVVSSITGFVWANKTVAIAVDGDAKRVSTQAQTVGALLRDQGVAVSDGDVVSPPASSALKEGTKVVVRHAVPVSLVVDGKPIELDVVGDTVADALVSAGLDPSDHPAVSPGVGSRLRRGMRIEVPQAYSRVVEVDEQLPFAVVTRPDSTRLKGVEATITSGAPGVVHRVYRVVVTDGSEGVRELTSEEVVTPPIDEVVAVGSASSRGLARRSSGAPDRAVAAPTSGRRMKVTATGYAPGSDGVDWRTATGGRAGYGVVAVDPHVIPMGTRLFIPGYGYGVASDTGGAIDGKIIDLCFETRAEALIWGRRTVNIIILD
jgi:uncharacterized protein YabE (DUF348 family)